MDLKELKGDLLNWLEEVEDGAILQQVQAIKEGDDWWNQISDTERKAIDSGLKQLDNGQSYTHEEVMSRVRSRFDQ